MRGHRTLREALERQGLALAAWVNIVKAQFAETENGEDLLIDRYLWGRAPGKDEVQEALAAQNQAAEALNQSLIEKRK